MALGMGLSLLGASFVHGQAAPDFIDLSFANNVEPTNGQAILNLGPSFSGTVMRFTNVAPGLVPQVDLRISVTGVSPGYVFNNSIPDYRSNSVGEPNGDLGYVYSHNGGASATGGITYTLEFFEGGGTFTTPMSLPQFRMLMYDVDGESIQSESVRVFASDGFFGFQVPSVVR